MSNGKNFFSSFSNDDFYSKMANMGGFPFDMKTMMEAPMKNAQAFTEAQRQAMTNLQGIMQRQAEFVTQMVQSNSEIVRQIAKDGTPEEKVSRQTDLIKKNYEKSVDNMREIADMVSKSSEEASEIIHKRVTTSLNEIKRSLETTTKSKAKTAA